MNPIVAIKKLYEETVVVLKKCNWPSRDELKGETLASVSFLLLMTAFLFIADQVFMFAVRTICM